MSETLSAERALNLLRLSARVDPLLRQAVADVELHIDAQATEIAALKDAREQIEGYRQALEHWICRAHRIGEHGEHQAGNPDCDYARRALGQI